MHALTKRHRLSSFRWNRRRLFFTIFTPGREMASKAKNQELEEKVPEREVLIRPPAHTPPPSDSSNREKKNENSLFKLNTFGFPLLPLARICLWNKCHEGLETVQFFFLRCPWLRWRSSWCPFWRNSIAESSRNVSQWLALWMEHYSSQRFSHQYNLYNIWSGVFLHVWIWLDLLTFWKRNPWEILRFNVSQTKLEA